MLPAELAGACVDVLRSSTQSREAMERELVERYAASGVVLTGSGTQALQLALILCKRELGDDVTFALPAYSCYDLVTAAVGAGVQVVFYDIDPVSLSPDEESLHEALDSGAGVIVAGNLYGFPLDWDALRTVCGARDVTVVEDAAQGLGSSWKGTETGALGDMSILSFGRGKGWNGGGGGALLVRRGEALGRDLPGYSPAPTLAGVKAVLLSLAMWAVGRPELYRFPSLIPGLELGETVYHAPGPVRGMQPTSAAIARRHATPSLNARALRVAWADRWLTRVVGVGSEERAITPCIPLEGGTSGWLRFPVLASSAGAREEWAAEARDVGATRGYPVPLPRLPQTAALRPSGRTAFPGAERLAETLFTLPTHPRVAEKDLKRFASLAASAQ